MAELRGSVCPSQWPWILDAGLGGCVWPWHGRCLPRASAALGAGGSPHGVPWTEEGEVGAVS